MSPNAVAETPCAPLPPCSKTATVLEQQARQTGHRFHLVDKLYLAVGWGYGHGAAHVIFFFLVFLPITSGEGTWYAKRACH